MRTDAESSRYAAWLGVVITAVTALAVLSGAGLLTACGGGHEPAGAAVPARPGAAAAGNPSTGNP
ncbi:hypothetical protein ND748_28615, partial [Frankia sp. AiPs1]|nr:hypothetical protein [Frankia sp. AiPs1]